MHIPWEDVQLFLAVADGGSITAAAKVLRVGQPTVSRRLADLEYRLGDQLFRRTVEGVQLTYAGERLVLPARKMAEWAGEVARAAEKRDQTPSGLVRITAIPSVAFDFVTPFAAWLRTKYPELRIEVLASTTVLDLARGEADLALRGRRPGQPELTLLHTLQVKNAIFVAKDLAKTLPRPLDPAKLPWIAWAPPFENVTPNPELEAMIPNFRPAFTADSFLIQMRACELGLGAMVLADVHHRFSRSVPLVPLDVPLGPHATSELHLVCARSALDIPRVRLVADLLTKELAVAGGGEGARGAGRARKVRGRSKGR